MRYWGGSVLVAAVAAVVFTTAAPVRAGSAAVGANLDAEPRISRQDSERLIRAVARMYDLDPSLLAAIARVESGGNPQAVSPKGAEGMMQLMPATAIRFGVLDPFDPVSNVLGAARFLAFLRNYHPRSDGSAPSVMTLAEMLAAYNAGEGAVDKYRGIPPYAETQQYV
ncbi:MAG: lytic transglycosylase domain-containing protein, partial [Candidatus Binataceae bacterium]